MSKAQQARSATLRELLDRTADRGTVTTPITLTTRTKSRLKAAGKLAYSQGVMKESVGEYVTGLDYESSVNAQRIAEGKLPDFSAGQLFKGQGAADKDHPAYIARHIKSGKEYLMVRPAVDDQGHSIKEYERYIDLATGNEIVGDELEQLKSQYLTGGGGSKRQGLDQGVAVRTIETKNILAAKLKGDRSWTNLTPTKPPPLETSTIGADDAVRMQTASKAFGSLSRGKKTATDVAETLLGGTGGGGGGGGGGPSGPSETPPPEDQPSSPSPRGSGGSGGSGGSHADAAAAILQHAAGRAIGRMIGGPGGSLIGSIISGDGGSIASTVGSTVGYAMGGAPGSAVGSALGSIVDAIAGAGEGKGRHGRATSITSAGGAGGGGGSSEALGGGPDEGVALLRELVGLTRIMAMDGIKVLNHGATAGQM